MPDRQLSTNTFFLLGAAITAWVAALNPVFAQEAYYWNYAQHPDLSYFDHPPMVAWMIWVGTAVFGDGSVGIRLGTWLCGLGTAWFGWRLLRDFGIGETGQRLWLVIGIGCPSIVIARVLANPDPGLVCWWTLTLWALWRARDGGPRWWLVAGLGAGLALLSKYTAAFLLPTGLLLFVFEPKLRRQLATTWPYVAVVIAAAVFSPVVIWNLGNHFESFKFQTEGRFAKAALTNHWWPQLLGGQFGLFNPLLALMLPATLLWSCRRALAKDQRLVLLLAAGVPMPAYMLTQSLFMQVKSNWLTPAYVPLLLAMVLWWSEVAASGAVAALRRIAVWVMLGLQVPALALPLALPFFRSLGGSSWSTLWRDVAVRADAWKDKVDAEDGVRGNTFFFGANYRDASQLALGLKNVWRGKATGPTGEPVMAQNVMGLGSLMFDHWEQPSAHVGQTAIFALPRPDDRDETVARLGGFFDQVEKVERVVHRHFGVEVESVDLYVCRRYHGPKPD